MNISSQVTHIKSFFVELSLFNSISLVLTIFSLLVAFYFYFKGKESKEIVCYKKTVHLTEDGIESDDSIVITYNGDQVRQLTLTQIAIWNKGNKVINFSDLAPTKPLEIFAADEVKIYSVEIVRSNNDAQNFDLLPVEDEQGHHVQNKMKLVFDYIDPMSGVLIQILHTGRKDVSVSLSGKLKQFGDIKEIDDYIDILVPSLTWVKKMNKKQRRYFLASLLFFSPIITFLPLLFPALKVKYEYTYAPAIISLTIIYWIGSYLVLKSRIPKGIEPFV